MEFKRYSSLTSSRTAVGLVVIIDFWGLYSRLYLNIYCIHYSNIIKANVYKFLHLLSVQVETTILIIMRVFMTVSNTHFLSVDTTARLTQSAKKEYATKSAFLKHLKSNEQMKSEVLVRFLSYLLDTVPP